MDKDQFLTKAAAGHYLGLQHVTITRWIRDRRIKTVRVGGQERISVEECERIIGHARIASVPKGSVRG